MGLKQKISRLLKGNPKSTTKQKIATKTQTSNSGTKTDMAAIDLASATDEQLQVKSKRELAYLIKRLGLTGEGVEIGIQYGKYTELILGNSDLKRLYAIDPWIEYKIDKYEDDYSEDAKISQEQQDYRYLTTIFRLNKFGMRSVVMRMTSVDACKLFSDGQLDFIFIDGNHAYEAVKEDLQLWYPKVRKGGLFSGDDYMYTPRGKTPVKDAVDEFMSANHLKFYLTAEEWPRWYLIKP